MPPHHAADEPWLWLGKRGRMNDSGVYQMIVRRAARPASSHPHQLRNTSPPPGCAPVVKRET